MIELLSVRTPSRTAMVDITDKVSRIVSSVHIEEGMCLVYSQHTTCGITVNENADPDVKRDMLQEIDKIVPFEDDYHHLEGNSAAHIKSTLVGSSVTIPVSKGTLLLGTCRGSTCVSSTDRGIGT